MNSSLYQIYLRICYQRSDNMYKNQNGYVKKSRNKVLLKHKFFSLSVKVKNPDSLRAQEMLKYYHNIYIEVLNETKKSPYSHE